MESVADEELLRRIEHGDEMAVGEIYDRYQALVYGLAMRIVADQHTAQDVLQETFLGVWRAASSFESGRASARTWILAVARHRAIDALRRRKAPTFQLPDTNLPHPRSLVVPDVWPEIELALDAHRVRLALGEIPELQRQVLELAYFGGLSQSQIASVTGTPIGTVKGRARSGLRHLRRLLLADAKAEQLSLTR